MITIGVWRSLYRVIKRDVLGDFRFDVSAVNANDFELQVQRVALACNRALALVNSRQHSDLGVAALEVASGLRKIVEIIDSPQSKSRFEEHIAAVNSHLEDMQSGDCHDCQVKATNSP